MIDSPPPPPPHLSSTEASPPELPRQQEFYRAPVRFGHVPVEREPLGWDPKNPGFRNHYPVINLPTQIVERVRFGAPELAPNRLIWGDNLHVMRQLPSESVDLIYIDPPFFSNRTYNVIWGDENEERSFSDIWEGGLDGYLIWLNARLYEMKRLLKPTGSIYVHCDWHASHYIKVEMDKIFGYENFRNEIVWHYGLGGFNVKRWYPRKHDVIFYYSKSPASHHNKIRGNVSKWMALKYSQEDHVGKYFIQDGTKYYLKGGKPIDSVWDDDELFDYTLNQNNPERVGYPTQKPEALIERIINASSNPGDLVLDAFCGGGGTGVVAQRLGRRWIMCDQSRVAVAVTAERLKNDVYTRELGSDPIPDFTVEQWGIYEAEKLSAMPPAAFREFVLHCYDARIPSEDDGIHGYKGGRAQIPVWVGPPDGRQRVGAAQVNAFAEAITRLERYRGDEGLRGGIMLAWGFRPGAQQAAEQLAARGALNIGLVRLQQVTLESGAFRQHINSLSTERGDYSKFLTFILPPEVKITHKRLKGRRYSFDAGGSQAFNEGAQIINVQWDFDHRGGTFRADREAWLQRRKQGKQQPETFDAQHTFPRPGRFTVACKVQDDQGGEGLETITIDVE